MNKEKAIDILKTIKEECLKEPTKCNTCAFHKLIPDFVCPFGYTPERWQV